MHPIVIPERNDIANQPEIFEHLVIFMGISVLGIMAVRTAVESPRAVDDPTLTGTYSGHWINDGLLTVVNVWSETVPS